MGWYITKCIFSKHYCKYIGKIMIYAYIHILDINIYVEVYVDTYAHIFLFRQTAI